MVQRLTMTDANLEALSNQQRQRFEDEMTVHLKRVQAGRTARMTDSALRQLIRSGIEKAGGYGIVLEGDVSRYIEMMLTLAPDFDEDPQRPWAKETLTTGRYTARQKLDRLVEFMVFHQAPDGPDAAAAEGPPLDTDAARAADHTVWSEHPSLHRRRLTMDDADADYRRSWMTAYHAALSRRGVRPATSRPHSPVGSPVADPSGVPTGDLIVVLFDRGSQDPFADGVVQISSARLVRQSQTDHMGEARFEAVPIGDYNLLAVAGRYAPQQRPVRVDAGSSRLVLSFGEADTSSEFEGGLIQNEHDHDDNDV